MHETSLARRLLSAVLEHAERNGAARVIAVKGFIAETETLSRASLGFHFAALARGTIAEGAALELRLIHVEARCKRCDAVYAPEHHVLLCPCCGASDSELPSPTGLGLDTVEILEA